MTTARTVHLPATHCPHITPLVTVAYEEGQPVGYWATAICEEGCGIFASPVEDTIDKVQGWCDAHGYPSRAQAGRKGRTMKTYQTILNGGLFSTNNEAHFSWSPCPVCGGFAGDRYDVKGFTSEEARDEGNAYKFEACPDCIYEAHYGKRP